MRRSLLTLLVLAGVIASAVGAIAQSEEPALVDARRRVEAVARELEQARGRQSSAELALAEADRHLQELEAAVNDAAVALEQQEQAVVQAGQQLADYEAEVEDLRQMLESRAARIYKSGSGLPFELILTSANLGDALQRGEYLRVITGADQASLEEIDNALVQLAAHRERFDAEQARLEEVKAEVDQLYAQAQELREQRALAAAEAARRVRGLAEQKENLEADQARLAELIRRNQSTPATGSLPSTAGYIWPSCGPVTSEFGRRWGRRHEGIDIDGNTGDPLAAAKDGVVIYADWQGGYGRLILIDHGDGVVTAYAHQSGFAVSRGQSVARGQRIGYMGNTGNSTGSHLHFETRVNGTAVNPRRFLPGSRC